MRNFRCLTTSVMLIGLAAPALAQDTWSSGGFITDSEAQESLVQNGLGMQKYGFENDATLPSPKRVADDFEVPEGELWIVDAMTFYALQALGYVYEEVKALVDLPIRAVDLRLWDRPPNDSEAQNIFSTTCTIEAGTLQSESSNVYRVEQYVEDYGVAARSPATNAKQWGSQEIMKLRCAANVSLDPGTYWADWQFTSDDLDREIHSWEWGAQAIPLTILNQTTTGNGLYYVDFNEVFDWYPALDVGQQGFAFEIEGRFISECEVLRKPLMTGIGDAACGGSTSDQSPFLKWRNVDNNQGYRWEVRDSSGSVISSGITGAWVNIANTGHLVGGPYAARVQSLGDGTIFCDSDWSDDCAFTIGDGSGPEPEIPDFTWWPDTPKVGERVRFAELSTESPVSWSWDFGDGFTSDQQNPHHVFRDPGTYQVTRDVELPTGHIIDQKSITVSGTVECGNGACESGETAWSCPADCALEEGQSGRAPASDRRPTVPAAASGIRGAKATFWTTEGWIFNPSDEPATMVFEFTKRNQSTVYHSGPIVLGKKEGRYWASIIEELFQTTGTGALWVDSDVPVLFMTRTYNFGDNGSYGQSFAGIQERLTLRAGDGGVYLVGLREDGDFRTNLYFQEIDGSPILVDVDLFSETGERIGGESFTVDSHSMRQRNLGMDFGVSGVQSAFARVSVTSGDGRLAAAASVIDEITGDPTSVQMVHPSQVATKTVSEVHNLVAAVSHTDGAVGSVWRSALTVNNTADAPKTVRLVYKPEYDRSGFLDEVVETNVSMEPGTQRSWEDVLAELFGLPESSRTQGSLHVYSDGGVIVESRTYNERAQGGTLGLGLPALNFRDMIRSGETGIITGMKHTPETRTNIGLAEFTGSDAEFEISFFSVSEEADHFLGFFPPKTVRADSHTQLLQVFDTLNPDGDRYNNVVAFVTVSGGGAVYAYATVIENSTGDAAAHVASPN